MTKRKPAKKQAKKQTKKGADDKKIDDMLGGAIDPGRVIAKDVEAPTNFVSPYGDKGSEDIFRMLKEDALHKFHSQAKLQEVADALHDYRPRNNIGYDQYVHHFDAYPEDLLVDNLKKHISGHGSSRDHPRIHQLVMDSFQHYPKLLSLYTSR